MQKNILEISKPGSRSLSIFLCIASATVYYMTFLESDSLEIHVQMLYHYGAIYAPLILQGEYFRFVSSNFLHLNFSHLLLSCAGLLVAGGTLERMLDKKEFLTVTFVSGLFGGAFVFILAPTVLSVGMFGIVFGYISALIMVCLFCNGIKLPERVLLTISALILIVLSDASFLSEGLKSVEPVRLTARGITSAGHIGGFIGGIVTIIAFLTTKHIFVKTSKNKTIVLTLVGSLICLGPLIFYARQRPEYHTPFIEATSDSSVTSQSVLNQLEILKNRHPEYFASYILLGYHYIKLEDNLNAYEKISKAYDLNPDNDFVMLLKINALFNRQKYQSLLELTERFENLYPKSSGLFSNIMIISYINTKNFDKARNLYDESIAHKDVVDGYIQQYADVSDEQIAFFVDRLTSEN